MTREEQLKQEIKTEIDAGRRVIIIDCKNPTLGAIAIELDENGKTAISYDYGENGDLSNRGVLTEANKDIFNAMASAFAVDPKDYGVSLVSDKDVKIDLEDGENE